MSGDRALEGRAQPDGEARSVEFGDALTAPFGQAVVGLAMSVYGGLFASFITVAVTTNVFVGVAGVVASIWLALGALWVVEYRLRRRSAARIGIPLAVAGVVSVVGLVAIQLDAGEPWLIVVVVGVVVIGALAVADRALDSTLPAPDTPMRSQMIAFFNGGPPRWARDMQGEIAALRDVHTAAIEATPVRVIGASVVVRTSSMREWWRLRPRWKGPTE